MNEDWDNRKLGVAALAVLIPFALLYGWMGFRDPVIHLHDFFGHLRSAASIGAGDLGAASSPWFPVGYPVMLQLARTVIGSDILAGRLLSAGSALVCLGAILLLSRSLIGAVWPALFVTVATGLSPPFLEWARAEGTDLPSLAFLLLAMVFLARKAPWPLIAGVLAGLSYVMRFSSLVPCLATAIWLCVFGLPGLQEPRDRRRLLLRFGGGWLLGASPQLLLSLGIHGTPFHSYAAKNVWFGIYGERNWQSKWGEVPDTIGLLEVIGLDPVRFFQHWVTMMLSVLVGATMLPSKLLGHGVNWLLPLGLIHVAWNARGAAGLYFASTGAYLAALCMAFLGSRYLLVVVPAFLLAITWFLWILLPPTKKLGGRELPVRGLVLVILLVFKVPYDLLPALDLPESSRRIQAVSQALSEAGMERAEEVVSTSGDYQDLRTLLEFRRWNADRFEKVTTLKDLVAAMRRRGYRFLIYDRFYGVQRVSREFEFLLQERPDRHGPLKRLLHLGGGTDQETAVYLLEPAPR